MAKSWTLVDKASGRILSGRMLKLPNKIRWYNKLQLSSLLFPCLSIIRCIGDLKGSLCDLREKKNKVHVLFARNIQLF